MTEKVEESFIEVNWLIRKSEMVNISSCFEQISKIIEKSENVPSHLIKQFIGYFNDKDDVRTTLNKVNADKLANKAREHFEKFKGYDFEFTYLFPAWKDPNRKSKREKLKYTFYDCVYNALYQYFKYDNITEKDDAIRFFRSEIEKEIEFFGSKATKILSEYKKAAISAYLATIVGFKVSTLEKITNDILFQATRNAIKKKH